ncbi:hypothetical protein [Actinobaculum sp. 352]|uniref:hypothetical protein n=1 Tax=Actinobaculum sp. 352 TaxID=2490946 RepID=UPI000F7E1103|nr:hypothetical protein [Actinobaculum sp. 352]RTE48808.1 hypothetical protein EKN07_08870 [Actinobaculum sp. 352]
MRTQTISFTLGPTLWMSANHSGRVNTHWAVTRRKTMNLRRLAAMQARAQRLRPPRGRVRVTAWVQYPTRGRADPNNAAPTTKALIDGLTDAGIWPDDDHTHVIGPDHRRANGTCPRGLHIITLTIEEEAKEGAES